MYFLDQQLSGAMSCGLNVKCPPQAHVLEHFFPSGSDVLGVVDPLRHEVLSEEVA